MFKRSTTSECGVTQHTTTTIQYERYNTDGAKICSRKQRTKYDRRYDEEANRARRRGSVSGKPERHTRENFHTHYDSSPLTFGRHEEPMRNLFCTRNKKIETRRKISQSATICRIFLGGKLARSRSSSSSTRSIFYRFGANFSAFTQILESNRQNHYRSAILSRLFCLFDSNTW